MCRRCWRTHQLTCSSPGKAEGVDGGQRRKKAGALNEPMESCELQVRLVAQPVGINVLLFQISIRDHGEDQRKRSCEELSMMKSFVEYS
jgi:hypothetical protein